MKKYFKFLLVLILIMVILPLSSCSQKQEKADEKLIIRYANGQMFCEGVHQITKKGKKIIKNRKGIWKFYNINGNPEEISEYSAGGELLNHKVYNQQGKLMKSEMNSEAVVSYTEYYENGNIKYESVTETEYREDGEQSFETSYQTMKSYFENGQLESQKDAVDNELQGKARKWDSKGKLLIEYEYVDGLIKQQ